MFAFEVIGGLDTYERFEHFFGNDVPEGMASSVEMPRRHYDFVDDVTGNEENQVRLLVILRDALAHVTC